MSMNISQFIIKQIFIPCQWSKSFLLIEKEYRFLLPASLIAINDVAAYFFGFFFGRTPLIKLSPKKTWEGFIGASFATIISAFVVSSLNSSWTSVGFLLQWSLQNLHLYKKLNFLNCMIFWLFFFHGLFFCTTFLCLFWQLFLLFVLCSLHFWI